MIFLSRWRNRFPNRREADNKLTNFKRCFAMPVSFASLFQYRFSCDCVMTYCQSIKQTSQWRQPDLKTNDSTFRLIESIRKCRLNSHRRASLDARVNLRCVITGLRFHLHATNTRKLHHSHTYCLRNDILFQYPLIFSKLFIHRAYYVVIYT